MDILGPAGRALDRYHRMVRRIGPFATPLAAGAVPAVAALLFLFAVSVSLCGEGCGFLSAFFLVPAIYASFAVFVAAFALVLARRALRRQRRDLVITTAMRVQSLKDWFVRGDIAEQDYQRLRAKMETISQGTASHMAAQDAARFYQRFAAILWTTTLPAIAFFVVSFLALADGQIVALPFAFVAFLGAFGNAWGIFYGTRRGRELDAAARQLGTRLIAEIDQEEADMLRTANQRKAGPAAVSPEPYRRATFRPFSGR